MKKRFSVPNLLVLSLLLTAGLVPILLTLNLLLTTCNLMPEIVEAHTFKNTMAFASLTVSDHPDYPQSETIKESYYVRLDEGHIEYFLLDDTNSAKEMYEKYYEIAADESFAPTFNMEINLIGYERLIQSSDFLGTFYSDVIRIDNVVIYAYGENPAAAGKVKAIVTNLGL